jgi:hypothetical protein
MTTVTKCRAKDPTACPYHGAVNRMTEAIRAGDVSAYITAQQDMEKAKSTPEVAKFFARQQAAKPAKETLPYYNRSEAQGLGAIKFWATSKIAIGQDSTTPPDHHYATAKAFGKVITYLLDSDENGNPSGIVGRIETYRGKSVAYNGNSLQGGNYVGSPETSEDAFNKIIEANKYRVKTA